jgi:uncharacterized membrane protein (UPF0127 family)
LHFRVTGKRPPLVIGDHIETAATSLSRMVGLLGRSGLEPGGGLWIKPSAGVHTVGMTFAIDVIGLDKDNKVIKLWSNLVPYRITSVSWRMRSVIELPAGTIVATGVMLGDSLYAEHHCQGN